MYKKVKSLKKKILYAQTASSAIKKKLKDKNGHVREEVLAYSHITQDIVLTMAKLMLGALN